MNSSSCRKRQRPSAAERELVIRRLREGCEDERLSLDTFSARVEEAYAAASRAELEELVGDLPRRSALACGLNGGLDFLAVTCNYGVQLLLDLAQKPRGIDPGEVPVNVLVNNFDEREQLGQ